jgi:trimeric autotransporter adhesin
MNSWIQLKAISLFLIAVAYFAPSPGSRAVSPPPDGGYPTFNTAEGEDALFSRISGDANTAIGFHALYSTTTGFSNTATGTGALENNTTGAANMATGAGALSNNTTGGENTAAGTDALKNNTMGGGNTATGADALVSNTTGNFNIADGFFALSNNFTGSNNIAIGHNALSSNTAGISGVPIAGGVGVVIDNNGQLGTISSSERFKDAIKPMGKVSEAILALKPVIFRYKKELDPDRTPQFGLVAEEVEKVNPDLVVRDEEGRPYSVRYDQVNAMLLNEFLKEHRTVQELKKEIAALTATVQKVSAQVEMSRPAPQTVVDNH